MDYAGGHFHIPLPTPQYGLLCTVRVTGDIYEVNPGTYFAAVILATIMSETYPNFPNLLLLSPLHPGCPCGDMLGFPSHQEASL